MKLRVKGNSLRLRVARSELAALLASGRIEETIRFTPARDAVLTYALAHEPSAVPVRLEHKPTEISVLLSTTEAQAWADCDQVGIYANLDLGASGQLEIAVEKDFACLALNEEDNADTFPNPDAESKTC